MLFSDQDALLWCGRLIAWATLLQTVEFLQLKPTFSWLWDWKTLRKDFDFLPSPIRATLDAFLNPNGFQTLLWLRFAASIALLFWAHPMILGVLLASSILISLRWRGTFNGGSDFMTLIVLSALFVAHAFPRNPEIRLACLWYIALQTCTSYFLAGWGKIKKANWRSGRAITGFLSATIYEPHPALLKIGRSAPAAFLASWVVLSFECAFPVALFHPSVCLGLLALAGVFHFGNVAVFGLNRFFWAWLSAYPALYFCSQLGFKI